MPDHKNVAIVDDEAGIIKTYELRFKRRGIPMAFVACDGPEAVEKFKNQTRSLPWSSWISGCRR